MSKQLSLSERIVIERMLAQNYTFATIARKLERSASTIAREVKNYRCFINPDSHKGNDCIHFHSCLRNRVCPDSGVHGCYGYRCKFCPEGISCISVCSAIPLLTALSTTNHPIPVIPATLLNKNPASIIMLITLLTELMQLI